MLEWKDSYLGISGFQPHLHQASNRILCTGSQAFRKTSRSAWQEALTATGHAWQDLVICWWRAGRRTEQTDCRAQRDYGWWCCGCCQAEWGPDGASSAGLWMISTIMIWRWRGQERYICFDKPCQKPAGAFHHDEVIWFYRCRWQKHDLIPLGPHLSDAGVFSEVKWSRWSQSENLSFRHRAENVMM